MSNKEARPVLVGSAKVINEAGEMFVSIWTEVNGEFTKVEYGPYVDDFSGSEEKVDWNAKRLFSTTLSLQLGYTMTFHEDAYGDLQWCIYLGFEPKADSPTGVMEWRRETDEYVIDLRDFAGYCWVLEEVMKAFPQLH